MICCGSSGDNCTLAFEKNGKTANNNNVVVLKCQQLCVIISLLKSRQNISRSSFYVDMFIGCALFCPFFYAFCLPSFTVILFFSLHPLSSSLSKVFPLFLECLRRSTSFPPPNPLRHEQKKYYRKRDDTERGENKGGWGGEMGAIENQGE